ncbi:MAG: ComF family protein [Cyanobacteria bacterium SBLK]|nr:ComF family protein [Cyanobacteria bacterium SBLK]
MSLGWLRNFRSLFLIEVCPLCDRPAEEILCRACETQLQRCRLAQPEAFWQGESPLLVWGNYGGILKRAIAAMKYENHPEIAELLGEFLGRAWLDVSPSLPKMVVVPVPMNPEKRKQRGFDQAELIARSFCRQTGFPLKCQGLQRVKETQPLFDLNPQERELMMRDAFALGKDFQKERSRLPVLLVDDLYTTGNTVKAGAKTLSRAGIRVGGIAAVASPRGKATDKR